ncbi:MAG: cation transporter [Bacteroidetes bacterium HGW-Bacteroidetes-21]|jgi:trk system potassium uptake protein TrkH|nr:MAG: cation transporter [Bacteroidetes bacterium HGW-Bacteroidetes-21]
MRFEVILKYVGMALILNALFMFLSFILALVYSETTAVNLLYSTVITFGLGILPSIYIRKTNYLTIHEGVMIVVMGWLATCITGTIPYVLWGGEFNFVNALFESVSGYTTTGASILSNIEALPKSILFWRSSTHFIGGIGVILFGLLILSDSGSRLTLFNAEVSQLAKTNFSSKAKETLKILLYVYLGLNLLQIICLYFAGMSLFDSVNHAFATIATGGFSTKNTSIAYFDSVWIEVIIIFFMLLSGIHFGLIFNTFSRGKNNIFRSGTAKAFLIFIFTGVLLVAIKLYSSGTYDSFWVSLRHAAFQVVSLASTTGFASTDSAIWPFFTQIILIYFTIQCAMVGSTAGGLKFDRVWVMIKSIKKQIRLMQHPRAIINIKVDGKPLPEGLEQHTMVFIAMYMIILLITTLTLTAMNVDTMTAFSGAVATLGNVGPGFNEVGSMANYGGLPEMGKVVLSANMLLGRLEIFGILSLFFYRSWK